MASFNRVILVGNITRDPELRYISNGTAVSDIGLAVNDRRKDASGKWGDETTFVDITLWGRQAEVVVEYASKGTQVLIEGRLKLDSWEMEGQKRSKLKIVGEKLVLLGNKGGGAFAGAAPASSSNRDYSSGTENEENRSPASYDQGMDDDIPF